VYFRFYGNDASPILSDLDMYLMSRDDMTPEDLGPLDTHRDIWIPMEFLASYRYPGIIVLESIEITVDDRGRVVALFSQYLRWSVISLIVGIGRTPDDQILLFELSPQDMTHEGTLASSEISCEPDSISLFEIKWYLVNLIFICNRVLEGILLHFKKINDMLRWYS
jgi:hypothetical protein